MVRNAARIRRTVFFMVLLDSVFFQDVDYGRLDGTGPEAIAMVGGMDAVHGGFMIRGCCARLDIINIRIPCAGNGHEAVCKMNAAFFLPGRCFIEIPVFPVNGALEDEWFPGMCPDKALDKGEEAFADLLLGGVGEGVKEESVHGSIHQGSGKIGLHFAVAAASQAEQLDTGGAGELGGIRHAAPGGADAVGETGPVNANPVSERVGECLYRTFFPNADLDGKFFAQDGKVQQAFFHACVHGGYYGDFGFFLVLGSGSCPPPLPVLTDVQVVSIGADSHGVDGRFAVSKDRFNLDVRAVGAKGYGNAGRFPYLKVLLWGKTLVPYGVQPVIGIGGVREEFSGKRKGGSLCVNKVLRWQKRQV